MAALLVLSLGLALLRRDPLTIRRSFAGGVLVALILLTRPEFVVLPVMLLLLVAATWQQRAAFMAGVACLARPMAGLRVGGLWHHRAQHRRDESDGRTSALDGHRSRRGAQRREDPGVLRADERGRHLRSAGAGAPRVARVPRSPCPIAPRSGGRRRADWVCGLGDRALVPAVYFVNQLRGGVELTYRYAAPTLPLIAVVGWLGVDRLVAKIGRHSIRRTVLVALAAIAVVGNVGMSILHLPFLVRSNRYVKGVLVEYGQWLDDNAAPTDVVAAYDVGALAYFAHRPVLDLVGLNSTRGHSASQGSSQRTCCLRFPYRHFARTTWSRCRRCLSLPTQRCCRDYEVIRTATVDGLSLHAFSTVDSS